MGSLAGRLSAWRTWAAWCQGEGYDAVRASPVTLRRYLYRPTADARQINAPRSRWDVLEWLRRHVGAPIGPDQVARPRFQQHPGEQAGAVAADPEIYLRTAAAVAELPEDPPWRYFGLVHLVLYSACMRATQCTRLSCGSWGRRRSQAHACRRSKIGLAPTVGEQVPSAIACLGLRPPWESRCPVQLRAWACAHRGRAGAQCNCVLGLASTVGEQVPSTIACLGLRPHGGGAVAQ